MFLLCGRSYLLSLIHDAESKQLGRPYSMFSKIICMTTAKFPHARRLESINCPTWLHKFIPVSSVAFVGLPIQHVVSWPSSFAMQSQLNLNFWNVRVIKIDVTCTPLVFIRNWKRPGLQGWRQVKTVDNVDAMTFLFIDHLAFSLKNINFLYCAEWGSNPRGFRQ